MSFLKKMQESNKAGLDFMKAHPMITGLYGSSLLDKVLSHETKPYIDEGKREGYAQASDEYEKKLLEQADLFLRQKNEFHNINEEKEKLLDELMAEIDRLDKKVKLTETENFYLQQLLLREHKLRKL